MIERGGPLTGIQILDLSTVVMGPWASHILADYGADVIKVEPPGGDPVRAAGVSRNAGMGSLFLLMNRSKRSVVLDLKRPQGHAALLRLCARADVLIHNIRPAAMQRLALGYDEVASVSPKLVYVSLVGYGQEGPYAAKPAYDDLIQGASGLAATFELAGGDEPRYLPVLIADRVTGMAAANAVLAALYARERSGRGQAIDVPMFETMVELVFSDHLGGHIFVPPAGPVGYNRITTPNRRPFRTSDGYVCLLVYAERQWERFFAAIDQLERYRSDARLSDPVARRADYDYAYGVVAGILATRTSREWLDLLTAADLPVMPLYHVEELLSDPHLRDSGFLSDEEHPTEGTLRSIRMPARWSSGDVATPTPAPRLGEHTREVLREAGLSEAEIDDISVDR